MRDCKCDDAEIFSRFHNFIVHNLTFSSTRAPSKYTQLNGKEFYVFLRWGSAGHRGVRFNAIGLHKNRVSYILMACLMILQLTIYDSKIIWWLSRNEILKFSQTFHHLLETSSISLNIYREMMELWHESRILVRDMNDENFPFGTPGISRSSFGSTEKSTLHSRTLVMSIKLTIECLLGSSRVVHKRLIREWWTVSVNDSSLLSFSLHSPRCCLLWSGNKIKKVDSLHSFLL